MNTYILVLTMIFKSGYGGMGGIETLEVVDLKACKRIGDAWIKSVNQQSKMTVERGELVYTCTPK